MVGAAARAGHAVVDLEQLEREVALAAVAEALLLAEQDVLVLAVGNGRINVRAAREYQFDALFGGAHGRECRSG